MDEVRYQKGKLYTSIHDFFMLGGDVNMRLSRETAIELCKSAIDYDILIWKIEASLLTNGYFDSFGSALFSQVCCRRWLICAASPPQAVLPHTPRSADKKRCKQSAAYVWCTVKPPVCRTILYFYRQTSHSTKI